MKFGPDHLIMNEIYTTPTIQGEGFNLGKPCYFIRLAFCNQACTWCDSKYSWDWANYDIHKETFQASIADLTFSLEAQRQRQNGPKHLVITGGEPMLQFDALTGLVSLLNGYGWTTEIETAGTIAIQADVFNHYNVSPKLTNSGNSYKLRFNRKALASFPRDNYRTSFKFVVGSTEDLCEIDEIVDNLSIDPSEVYLMPLGITEEAVTGTMPWLIPLAIERGYFVTTRLHILTWGARRGV